MIGLVLAATAFANNFEMPKNDDEWKKVDPSKIPLNYVKHIPEKIVGKMLQKMSENQVHELTENQVKAIEPENLEGQLSKFTQEQLRWLGVSKEKVQEINFNEEDYNVIIANWDMLPSTVKKGFSEEQIIKIYEKRDGSLPGVLSDYDDVQLDEFFRKTYGFKNAVVASPNARLKENVLVLNEGEDEMKLKLKPKAFNGDHTSPSVWIIQGTSDTEKQGEGYENLKGKAYFRISNRDFIAPGGTITIEQEERENTGKFTHIINIKSKKEVVAAGTVITPDKNVKVNTEVRLVDGNVKQVHATSEGKFSFNAQIGTGWVKERSAKEVAEVRNIVEGSDVVLRGNEVKVNKGKKAEVIVFKGSKMKKMDHMHSVESNDPIIIRFDPKTGKVSFKDNNGNVISGTEKEVSIKIPFNEDEREESINNVGDRAYTHKYSDVQNWKVTGNNAELNRGPWEGTYKQINGGFYKTINGEIMPVSSDKSPNDLFFLYPELPENVREKIAEDLKNAEDLDLENKKPGLYVPRFNEEGEYTGLEEYSNVISGRSRNTPPVFASILPSSSRNTESDKNSRTTKVSGNNIKHGQNNNVVTTTITTTNSEDNNNRFGREVIRGIVYYRNAEEMKIDEIISELEKNYNLQLPFSEETLRTWLKNYPELSGDELFRTVWTTSGLNLSELDNK